VENSGICARNWNFQTAASAETAHIGSAALQEKGKVKKQTTCRTKTRFWNTVDKPN